MHIKGPLHSIKAHGTINKLITFSYRKSKQLARQFYQPRNEIRLEQWTQRHIMGLLIAHWQSMTSNEKNTYNTAAKNRKLKMSGYNYFVKTAQTDLKTYHGLVAYYSMNERTGNTLIDNSKNNNTGTLKPTYPNDCPTRIKNPKKYYGNALNFDGINDYVDCGQDPSLNLVNALSIECWVCPTTPQEICWDGFTGNYGIAGKVADFENSANWSWQLRFGSPDNCRLGFQFHEAGGGGKWITAKQNLLAGVWYHIVGTYDGTTIKFYINGELKDTNTLTGIESYNNKLLIANEGWADHFEGKIDEFLLYNRALSKNEIVKHYNFFR